MLSEIAHPSWNFRPPAPFWRFIWCFSTAFYCLFYCHCCCFLAAQHIHLIWIVSSLQTRCLYLSNSFISCHLACRIQQNDWRSNSQVELKLVSICTDVAAASTPQLQEYFNLKRLWNGITSRLSFQCISGNLCTGTSEFDCCHLQHRWLCLWEQWVAYNHGSVYSNSLCYCSMWLNSGNTGLDNYMNNTGPVQANHL